jgi:hypothetical protein
MEVILVLVVVVIISGISLPYFAGTFKGTQLRTASRTISRMARYARSMAIMRETTLTVVLNHETMEMFLGESTKTKTSEADGKLDQDVLKRLGYVEDGGSGSDAASIDREVQRALPDQLTVRNFEKEWTEDDDQYEDLYLINYYPNGQCDWFTLELEDQRGSGVKLENDPISGKIRSEFIQ